MRSKQQKKDRAQLMALFVAAAPEGIEKHIKYSLEVEDGAIRLVWDKDDEGAAFINEFSANIEGKSYDPDAVMRELSIHIGQKMVRRTYDGQKGK